MTTTVHQAGPPGAAGVQTCLRCGSVLSDYWGVMLPTGSPPLRGWETGALVGVVAGNPTHSYVIAGRLPRPDEPLCAPAEGPGGSA